MDIKEMMQNSSMEVPDHLEMEVRNHLMELDGRKMPSYSMRNRVVKVAVSLMIMLSAIVMISKSSTLESLADKNPIVKALIGWMWEDEGVEYALENDYYNEDFYVVEGDYIIRFYNFTVDEQRLYFEFHVDNPNWPEENYYVPMLASYQLQESRIDYVGSYENNYGTYIGRFHDDTEEEPFSLSYSDVIKANAQLTLTVMINEDPTIYPSDDNIDEMNLNHHQRKTIDSFEINVDIQQGEILASKHYDIDGELVFDEGTIHLKELIISPTSMDLIVEEALKDGYSSLGLDKFRIECLVNGERQFIDYSNQDLNSNECVYRLTPSYFYEDTITDIYIRVLSYTYAYDKIMYEVDVHDLPTTISYHEIPVRIEKIDDIGQQLELQYSFNMGSQFDKVDVWLKDYCDHSIDYYYEADPQTGNWTGSKVTVISTLDQISVTDGYELSVQVSSFSQSTYQRIPIDLEINLKED